MPDLEVLLFPVLFLYVSLPVLAIIVIRWDFFDANQEGLIQVLTESYIKTGARWNNNETFSNRLPRKVVNKSFWVLDFHGSMRTWGDIRIDLLSQASWGTSLIMAPWRRQWAHDRLQIREWKVITRRRVLLTDFAAPLFSQFWISRNCCLFSDFCHFGIRGNLRPMHWLWLE